MLQTKLLKIRFNNRDKIQRFTIMYNMMKDKNNKINVIIENMMIKRYRIDKR